MYFYLSRYALNQRPDVLILIGPFVDQQHNLITDGTLMETYLSHFEKLMEQVLTPLQDTDIQVDFLLFIYWKRKTFLR